MPSTIHPAPTAATANAAALNGRPKLPENRLRPRRSARMYDSTYAAANNVTTTTRTAAAVVNAEFVVRMPKR
ncbi:MAG: hypothetical protein U1D00_07160 [Mycobacterium sp.]|nr:hypothetical protein [Mycobacterium sp.]